MEPDLRTGITIHNHHESDVIGMSSNGTPAGDYLVGKGVDAPCDLVVVGPALQPPGSYHVHCRAHDCEQEDSYPSEAQAREMFRCDRGRSWTFILHWSDDQPRPSMVDLSGLYAHLADGDEVEVIWQYLLDGTCAEVDLQHRPDGGEWHHPDELEDLPATAFRVINASGFEYLRGDLLN
jgi:hypothetical protein